jgi:hypothetical protein
MLQEILAALGTGDALAARYRRQLYSIGFEEAEQQFQRLFITADLMQL